MASKKSSSRSATPSPSPTPPSPSPAVFQHSYFKRRRRGSTTIATTPPPTTTTVSPTPDPYEYEKSANKNIQLADSELNLLKEHVRLLHGLPLTEEKAVRRINTLKPPKVWPRPTLTSERRAQLQQRRLVVRCGVNLKEKLDEYDRMTKSSDSTLMYRQLREEAMAQTSEDIDLLYEHQELQNLRNLAERAKENEVVEYRDNQGSRLRFKYIRGEPIISSNFRDAYDDYMKPPFAFPRRVLHAKVYTVPKIDKRKEIWLVPVDDEGIPLHAQPKTPDPKDKRSRKERARPKVQKGKRTSAKEWKDKKMGGKPTRPPWRSAVACATNIGSFR